MLKVSEQGKSEEWLLFSSGNTWSTTSQSRTYLAGKRTTSLALRDTGRGDPRRAPCTAPGVRRNARPRGRTTCGHSAGCSGTIPHQLTRNQQVRHAGVQKAGRAGRVDADGAQRAEEGGQAGISVELTDQRGDKSHRESTSLEQQTEAPLLCKKRSLGLG